MKVLIVEDEALIALDLEDMIVDAGHQVVGVAGDMPYALELAPLADFVFMDGRLRDGLTGPRAAHIIARDYGKPVFFLTGSAEEVRGQFDGGLGGAIGLISKPFREYQIVAALEEGEAWLSSSALAMSA